MKNSLERLNNKFELSGERISKLENGIIQMMQSEEQKEKNERKNKNPAASEICVRALIITLYI